MFCEIADILTGTLMDFDIDHTAAQKITSTFVGKFVDSFGGDMLYIPKKSVKQRNNDITSEYQNGIDALTLAKKYKMTTRQIYSIVK